MTAGTTPHTSETTSGPTHGRRRARQRQRSGGRSVRGHGDHRLHRPTSRRRSTARSPAAPSSTSRPTASSATRRRPARPAAASPTPSPTRPSSGLPASVTGTVTFTFFDMIWYVDADAPAGGNGTSRLPFNTFTAATLGGADGAGDLDDADDYIFVHGATAAISDRHRARSRPAPDRRARRPVDHRAISTAMARRRTLVAANAARGRSSTAAPAMRWRSPGRLPAEITGLALGTTVNAIDVTTAAPLTGAATLTIAEQRDRQRRRRGHRRQPQRRHDRHARARHHRQHAGTRRARTPATPWTSAVRPAR